MKTRTQKQIDEIVGLKPYFFNDIIHEREKCPPVYALRLAPLTEGYLWNCGFTLNLKIKELRLGKNLFSHKKVKNEKSNF